MDRFIAMQLFVRIVDTGSFTQAAMDMNISRASATSTLKNLETSLGVRLLSRTTRSVNTTSDGRFYYQQCLRILQQLNETEDILSQVASTPRGVLRVDLPNSFSRLEVIPKLSDFCTRYPDIQLILSASDRVINLVEESVDCVIRIGDLIESSVIARPINTLLQVTCASPSYLDQYGTPSDLEMLNNHFCVEYRATSTLELDPLVFIAEKEAVKTILPALIAVNNGDSYVAACEAGLGIIQIPQYHIRQQLAEGVLVEILPKFRPAPLPLSVVYSHHSHMKPAMRVFIDWMVDNFGN